MAEESTPQSWWHTLPGILTATAGIITAVTGLIVALFQSGFMEDKPAPQAQNTTITPPGPTKPATVPGVVPRKPSSTAEAIQYPIALPAGAEVRLGSFVYKFLAAQLDRYNVETLILRFTVRMTNNGRYDANFWDSSFRLLVDDVPTAPVSELNELVPGRSAKDGDVVFIIPKATKSAVLQVWDGDESTEIAIDITAKPG